MNLQLDFDGRLADELYVLVSSALPTTHRDLTCAVLKAM